MNPKLFEESPRKKSTDYLLLAYTRKALLNMQEISLYHLGMLYNK